MPASSWSVSNRRSGPGPGPARAGSRRRPTSTFSAACSPSSRTAGDGTASISPCTARWACAAWRGPRPTLPAGVREVVGRKAFIAGTFDPHGNEDAEFLRQADFAFCAKYFPHYDSRLQGERAARMLIRAIRGDYSPATATVKVPILTATVLQWTGASPWMDLVQRALTWEAREPDLYMNVFFGFPFADVPDVGMTVQATSNGNPELARKAAEDVATWVWRRREALLNTATVHPVPHGVTLAKEAVARGAWPVVLADHSDRSGSATWVLQQVIVQDLADVLIATIADRAAVEAVVGKGLKAGDP